MCSTFSGIYLNTLLVRAIDTLFPESVFGYQEYNLNKVGRRGGGGGALKSAGQRGWRSPGHL